ncbi:MAG: DNA translocase FtsK 4TM domain-containing protein, partial [Planctomycetota bacterium]
MARTSKVARARPAELSTEVLGLLLLGVTTFLFLSFYSEHLVANHGGVGALGNFCGAAGKLLSAMAFRWLGVLASYFLVLILAIWALSVFFRVTIQGWGWKLFGAGLLLVNTATLEWWFTSSGKALVGSPYDILRGGYLGEGLGGVVMFSIFDRVGTLLVSGLLVLIGFLLATDVLISPLLRLLFRRSSAAVVQAGRRIPGALAKLLPRSISQKRKAKKQSRAAGRKKAAVAVVEEEEFDEDELADDEEEYEEDEEEYEEEEEEDEEDEEDEEGEEVQAARPPRR